MLDEWLPGEGTKLSAETAGAAALSESMTGSFRALPTVRSELESATVSGAYVSVRERVRWQGKQGERFQAALAVYELRQGLLRRVWYLPAAP